MIEIISSKAIQVFHLDTFHAAVCVVNGSALPWRDTIVPHRLQMGPELQIGISYLFPATFCPRTFYP